MDGGAYVVRRWWGLAGGGVLLLVGVAGAWIRGGVPWIVWVALLFGAVSLWATSPVLRVDGKGVRLGRSVAVPWTSIREVVLYRPGAIAADAGLGLRLRPDAPLPRGVKSMIHDPNRPDEVHPALRASARNLDPARVASAVRTYGGGVGVARDTGQPAAGL